MSYIGFDALKNKMAGEGVRNPAAAAASVGRKKYGARKMGEASAFGRKHPGAKPMLAPKGKGE